MDIEVRGWAAADGLLEPTDVALLPHGEAMRRTNLYNEKLAEGRVDAKLEQTFGIDVSVLDSLGVDYSERSAMLDAYDSLSTAKTLPPDLSALNGIRSKLVKATMPRTDFSRQYLHRRLKRLQENYTSQVEWLAKNFGNDEYAEVDILAAERLLRLSLLNGQLQARQRMMWRGSIAVTSMLGGFGAVLGFAAKTTGRFAPDHLNSVESASLGGAFAASIGATALMKLARRRRLVRNFGTTHVADSIRQQLHDEHLLAETNFLYTSPLK